VPRAVVLGCSGPRLDEAERRLFAEADPLGFILFARNCESPEQVKALVDSLRAAVGRADAPVLIDQEGGRVARLKPPHWRAAPAPAAFGRLAAVDEESAARAAWLNARLLAFDLAALGITVDCTPVLDLRLPEGHAVIGDRAFADDPTLVARLGGRVRAGLEAGGVLPVVKHIPGHGRARVDSHLELPVVDTPRDVLEATDFQPFAALHDAPWAMTAHVVYSALDPDRPATTSPRVIAEVIRGQIGFDGVLVSDDLSMQALRGDLGARTRAALAAGCDLALHCNGDLAEMTAVAEAAAPVFEAAARRLWAAEQRRREAWTAGFDPEAARRELEGLLARLPSAE